jgi:pimeloyl-ACP methyl ester carboxylesterase
VATQTPENVKSVTILNTAAYRSSDIPKRIAFCRTKLGAFLVQALNAFAWPATFMASSKPLNPLVKSAYLFPYDNFKNRIAIKEFVRDIPLAETDESYERITEIENKLPQLKCPKLILWGAKDFCFHEGFYFKWKEIYPDAEAHLFSEAGHYVLEDEFGHCYSHIKRFLGESR